MTTVPIRDAFDAGGRGLQHQGLRRANERAVLTLIGFNAGVSNADIARLSGLAPQTVSAILTELDAAGLITRGEVLRGRRGQPATPISLHAEGAFAIGVEIGWRHVDVLLLNMHAQVLSRRHADYAFPDATTIVDDVAAMIDAVLAALPEALHARLNDIGVAQPTNIPAMLAQLPFPEAQLELWQNLDLAGDLARRTGRTVSLFNDGNAACWAELIAFPKPRPANFIYFLIGRYIGAGIIGEGALWEGPNGNSANMGAMLVNDAQGKPIPAHLIASVNVLESRLAAAGCIVDGKDPASWNWQGYEVVLDQWLADSARALAQIVFNTTTVIESGLVVIDAILPGPVVDQLVLRLEAELQLLPIGPDAAPRIMSGHLGALAPAVGAAELTLFRRYFSRTLADLAG